MGQQIPDRFLQRREIDRLRLKLLPTSECEKPPDKLTALFGRTLSHGEDPAMVLIKRRPLVEQPKASDHCGEQIVEIVSDAAGELADRVHFLRLDQLAFQRALLADVGEG